MVVYGYASPFVVYSSTTKQSSNVLAYDWVLTASVDAQNNKWFGSNGGITMFDGTVWTLYKTVDDNYDEIKAIAFDAQGNKWFGTEKYGVVKFDGNAMTTLNESDG